MNSISKEQIDQLGKMISDQKLPLAQRFRVVFTLRNIGGSHAIESLSKGLLDPSVLFKHEIAYVLGQMKDEHALNILEKTLENKNEHAMVRHEAAEAIGAIGKLESIPFLEKFLQDTMVEVKETCEIAIQRIKWIHQNQELSSPYTSVDPAPPCSITSTEELKRKLLNPSLSLFERYQALFALRNQGDDDAVMALVEGFNDQSALFRHEIAYVLGQMQNPTAVDSLTKVVENLNENPMVRHEAAESLGSIGLPKSNSIFER